MLNQETNQECTHPPSLASTFRFERIQRPAAAGLYSRMPEIIFGILLESLLLA